jgi:hypothetical protein
MALLIEARPRRDQQSATDCGAGFGSAREGGHQPVRWRPRRRRQRDAQTSGPNSRARARRGRIAMSEVLDNLLANGPHQGDKLISDRSSVTGSPACAVEFNRLAEWVVPVRAGTAIPGFQDRCLKLLGHPSFFGCQRLGRGVRLGESTNSARDGIVPASDAAIRLSSIQPNAKASRLEHSSTRLAVVSARNPLETMSWLRMIHLPPRCSSEFIKAFRIPDRNYPVIPSPIPGRQPEPQAFLAQALERYPSNA